MKEETFKICCRSVYPNCFFEKDSRIGIVARVNFVNDPFCSVAGLYVDGLKKGYPLVVVPNKISPNTRRMNFVEVSEDLFVNELWNLKSVVARCR